MYQSGHGPWGITLSTGTGKVVSELVLDGHASSADISGLAPSRFLK
jgi:glycine/D-amino acid oxidase-like deaminating enzyme